MDLNMCLVETIYKNGLSQAVKESKGIVDDQDWSQIIRDLEPDEAPHQNLAMVLDPIAMEFLNVSGAELVKQLPDELLGWLFDSAVVLAAR
jgi:hypothetical protein